MSVPFAIHLAATWALVGLIWTVQLLVYPQFLHTGHDAFRRYHSAHMRRITVVVAPLMLAEVATAAWLLSSTGQHGTWFLLSLLPLAGNWISTWLLQVPLHQRLEHGFDAATCHRLVNTNWIRTAMWTIRGLMLSGAALT